MLYGSLFAALGVASPFIPGLLRQDGLGAGAIGVVLAAGTAIRLLAGPFGGRLADRVRRPSLVLAGFTAAAALVAVGYAPARGLPLLLLVSVSHAAVLAPLTPVADALALGSAASPPGFAYGWVRGAGVGGVHRRRLAVGGLGGVGRARHRGVAERGLARRRRRCRAVAAQPGGGQRAGRARPVRLRPLARAAGASRCSPSS